MCDNLKLCGDCKFFCESMFIPGYEWYKRCTEGLPIYVIAAAPACKLFEERSNTETMVCKECSYFDHGLCSKRSLQLDGDCTACYAFKKDDVQDKEESYCVTCKFFSLNDGECRLSGEEVKSITKACPSYECLPVVKEDDFFDDDEEDVSDQFVISESPRHTYDRVALNEANYVELSKKAAAMDYNEQYAMASQFHSDVLFGVLSDRLRSHEVNLKRIRNILNGMERSR